VITITDRGAITIIEGKGEVAGIGIQGRVYVFAGEELHPPATYGVTVVSRSIKAAA